MEDSRTGSIMQQAQIPPNFSSASFENFRLPLDNPTAQRGLADVMLAVSAYARNYPNNPKPGLLLAGAPGSGKTHLAVAVLRLSTFEGARRDLLRLPESA